MSQPAIIAERHAWLAYYGRAVQNAFVRLGLTPVACFGRPGNRCDYVPQRPYLVVYHEHYPVLTVGISGRLTIANGGDFGPVRLALLNLLLRGLGRPEQFVDARERGWAVKGGPNQGPVPLAVNAEGVLEARMSWKPLEIICPRA